MSSNSLYVHLFINNNVKPRPKMKYNVFYLYFLTETYAVLRSKENVTIEPIDVISLFKKKYTVAEIVLAEEQILSEINVLIKEISEVLCFFFNIENINTNAVYEELFDNVDCDNIGIALTDEIMINVKKYGSEVNNYELPNYKKRMILYFEEHESIVSDFVSYFNITYSLDRKPYLGYVHIYIAVSYFFDFFLFLHKIKKLFQDFFYCLQHDDSHNIDVTLITNFFLQYETRLMFDFLYHSNCGGISRSLFRNGASYVKALYPFKCFITMHNFFKMLFPSEAISFFNLFRFDYDLLFYAFISLFYKELNKDEKSNIHSFRELILSPYLEKNSFFVQYDNKLNKFNFYFDEKLIDFCYMKSLVSSLRAYSSKTYIYLKPLLNEIKI